jgi:hypothetical protein
VLQIVTKMYFRAGVPLYSTLHRDVLYTNRWFLDRDALALPVGELLPSTSLARITAVTLAVTEHLEAEDESGAPSPRVASSGDELIDSLADVLSFGLNSVFSRDRELVARLVPDAQQPAARTKATRLFRDTFDASRLVSDDEVRELGAFMTQLLALNRPHFEAAMRAIRRIVRGMQRAADDPTLAYVDIVAAVESLSESTVGLPPPWERLDPRKRRLIDDALDDADAGVADRVRTAVLEAERAGAKSRFVSFVTDYVEPGYFRREAAAAVRALRGADFERAIKRAYDIRSRNVHALAELPPEAWLIADRADTAWVPDVGRLLTLEGLARLARHVVKGYVQRAPVGIDSSFDWRAAVPGVVQMQVAPQYWVWNADAFGHGTAGRYFSGFVSHISDVIAGETEAVTDMTRVLERIEHLLPGTAAGPTKTLMIAMYTLWHQLLAPEHHRPQAPAVLEAHQELLSAPSVPAFVVGLVSDEFPGWTAADWHRLAVERRNQRFAGGGEIELPPRVDAALQVAAAEHAARAGRRQDAVELARYAVEELPGDQSLIEWEARLAAGTEPGIELRAVAFGVDSTADDRRD